MRNTKSKTIPNCLRKYRKVRGLKQKEVAKILGFKSASMISRWERGYCLPSTLNLFRLAILYRTMVEAPYVDLLKTMREDLFKKEAKVLKKKQQNA